MVILVYELNVVKFLILISDSPKWSAPPNDISDSCSYCNIFIGVPQGNTLSHLKNSHKRWRHEISLLLRCFHHSQVSRDICARLNTFQLTFVKPASSADKNDLVHEVRDGLQVSRILLSADSRDGRLTWCAKINQMLTNIRAWDQGALKPDDYQVWNSLQYISSYI